MNTKISKKKYELDNRKNTIKVPLTVLDVSTHLPLDNVLVEVYDRKSYSKIYKYKEKFESLYIEVPYNWYYLFVYKNGYHIFKKYVPFNDDCELELVVLLVPKTPHKNVIYMI